MSTLSEQLAALPGKLLAEIEATAEALDLAPSTVGERVGQGGKFYARLKDGKGVRVETFDAVTARLQELRSLHSCEPSHGSEPTPVQGPSENESQNTRKRGAA